MDKENVDNVNKEEEEEEEYEVERIVGHKIVKVKSTKSFKYLIKWLNYDEADNSWEKEENVYAIDMIVQYWSNIPKTDKDRILFETLQAKKKNPIILPSPVKVAKVITASPSPPSSPTLQPTADPVSPPVLSAAEKPSIASFFVAQKKDERAPIASSSISPVKPTVEVQQTTIDTYKSSETTSSLKDKEKETATDLFYATSSENGNTHVVAEMNEAAEEYKTATPSSSEDEEDELESSQTKKRTRSTYTDYFTEQHKRKKKTGKDPVQEDLDVEIEYVSSEESKETDTVIFDEAFTTDPIRDWSELAVKIEYIGKEVDGGPIYCAVKWKDNAVSLHSLDLVRKKRPDLVIDAFVKSVYNE